MNIGSDCNILGGFSALGNCLNVRVYTDIHNLDLRSGLKLAIARQFPELTTQSVPLSLSFRRQGLCLRSALLLQWRDRQQIDLNELRTKVLESWRFDKNASGQNANTWEFQVSVPDTGWLEFQLLPQNLEVWLDRYSKFLTSQESGAIAYFRRVEPPSFPWQYLQQRCRDLLELAQDVAKQGSPQWQFENYWIPDWEQTLLDGVVRLFFKVLDPENSIGDPPLKIVELNTIEKAFWEFHRHCHLFAFYPAQPERFWHYCAWLKLLEAIATIYLSTTVEEIL